MTSILRVALPVPLHTLFDYREGAARAAVGSRVRVPFGRRERVGIVTERVDASTLDEARLKVAGEVLDEAPLLGGELLATLRWAARYYQHPLGEVLFAALPTSLRNARALPPGGIAAAELTPAGAAALAAATPRRGTRIASLLEALVAGPLATTRLDALAGAAARRNALARGWIARCRLATPAQAAAASAGPPLNDAQREAAQAVIGAGGGFAPFLLDGVTGSGKTEVYLEIIRDCLARGRQALVLVPEIALTPQALRRFRERLGVDVAALHSGLGEVERARAWLAAARGEAPLVLGTRSAVLVPLARPGVIIVDEEHDGSYKQQEGFRYHARDLALVRAKALGIPVVLGSATPSLESLANVEAKRYRLLRLDQRAGRARPPTLQVVDLRRQRLQHGLARTALEAIAACLARDEQVLVFRNRRGYAPVLLCHDCGWSARCPDCERALTLHKREGRLRCHHCGHEERVPAACPSCSGLALHALGEGTERLEDALGAQFPGVPVVRVDRDTTRGRRLRDALLDSLPEGGARILVGTQMLAKGHDLPHLTLVVVVGVDEGLYSVDFRAGERLGQLVVQVAGRAGRADRPGSVILQTHDPAHPLLEVLLNGGYRALASRLLQERRDAGLPPFVQFALLRAEAPQQDLLDRFLRAAAAAAGRASGVNLHGPLAAPMPRRAGAWRAQILVEAGERAPLQAFLPAWLDAVRALPDERRVRWSIDVDPVDLY
ncbi:primosomal protein N' [Dokdonella fugitiva]|uniref:Replication restart protein PriA n=1 Tax=Dokdonella fugitiva TaxID=328517 RepID=A0A4R2IBC4_9GAMM|nr:primosomal protein N' [Dokdonella fugitiva]TCO41416.1 replication restart DNA helicase PriA [Dokdonella fugitiva]